MMSPGRRAIQPGPCAGYSVTGSHALVCYKLTVGGRAVNWISVVVLVCGAAAWAAAPSILGLPDGTALWLGVGSAAALQAGSLLRGRRLERLNLRSTSTSVHRLSRDLDVAAALHLHRSQVALRASSVPVGAGLPPYVPGEIDDRVDQALAGSRFVLLVGNALSGKSRAAYEAVRRNFPKAEVWVPSGFSGLRALLEVDPPLSFGWRPVVVWLDGLDYYLDAPGGSGGGVERIATEALIARHVARRPWWQAWRLPRLSFVATMGLRERDSLSDRLFLRANRSQRSAADIVDMVRQLELADGAEAGWDMEKAESLYPDADFSDGIGRTFAEAETMLHAYRSGADEVGRGLVRSAIDWVRIGAGWPSRVQLRELLMAALPGRIVDDEEFQRGLRWANQEIAEGQRMLSQRPNGEKGGEATFVAHRLLVDADEGYGPDAKARTVADSAWDLALAALDARDLLAVADQASERDDAVAERILLRLADSDAVPGSDEMTKSAAHLMLGWLYQGISGREGDALERFAAATRAVDPDVRLCAHLALGQMCGREAQADRHFTDALSVKGASPDAVAEARYQRANWRNAHGEKRDAEADLSAAISSGHLDPDTAAWAYIKRSYIYAGLNRAEERLADLLAAVDLDTSPDLHAFACCALGMARDEPGRSIEDFTAALAGDCSPDERGSAYCLRAETFAELELFEEAEADYAAAIALAGASPDRAAMWRLDRIVKLGGRDPRRDREDCERVLMAPGVSLPIAGRAHLARANVEEERLHGEGWSRDGVNEVAEDFSKAIELGDAETRSEALYLRGRLFSEGYGTSETALEDLTAAIEADGATPHTVCSSYVHRALVHGAEGRFRDAEADFAAGIATPDATPRSIAVALVDRGVMRWELGSEDLAEEDFRAAVAVEGGEDPSAGALGYLGELLRKAGRLNEERSLFREAAKSGRPELVAVALPHLEAEARRRERRADRRRR